MGYYSEVAIRFEIKEKFIGIKKKDIFADLIQGYYQMCEKENVEVKKPFNVFSTLYLDGIDYELNEFLEDDEKLEVTLYANRIKWNWFDTQYIKNYVKDAFKKTDFFESVQFYRVGEEYNDLEFFRDGNVLNALMFQTTILI